MNSALNATDARTTASACELLTIKELSAILKLSVASIWRLVALAQAGLPCGGFPKPLRLGPKTVRFRLCEIEGYLDGLAGAEARP